jgi:Phage replication protein CRI
MLDTAKLRLHQRPCEGVLGALSAVADVRDYKAGVPLYYRGKLRNLDVWVHPWGVVTRGSLSKFHLGDNIQVLTRPGIERAIEHLSDSLGMKMAKADVQRVDFACNFQLSKPVSHYLSALGGCPRYERVGLRHGLLYRSTRRALFFYDKLHDVERHRWESPTAVGPYLLRYEYRILGRVREQLRRSEVTASMLYGEGLFNELRDRWRNEYFAIDRSRRLRLGAQFNGVRQLSTFLAVKGLNGVGEEPVMSMIQRADLSSQQKWRMRDAVKTLAKAPQFTEPDDCVLELDERVRQAAGQ